MKHLHVRGESSGSAIFRLLSGDISTYAEKTRWSTSPFPQCGGTSPHTWRKLEQISNQLDLAGNISTYAEKTYLARLPIEHAQEHLHIRGENTS